MHFGTQKKQTDFFDFNVEVCKLQKCGVFSSVRCLGPQCKMKSLFEKVILSKESCTGCCIFPEWPGVALM